MIKTIKIQLKDVIVLLKVDDESAFDTEDLLKIDHHNLAGEQLTFAIWVNRVGILKAQADDQVRRKKFECEICEAELAEGFRKSLSSTRIEKGGVKKVIAPVLDAVNNAVKLDKTYQEKMSLYFRSKRNAEYIDAFYWGIRSKEAALKSLSTLIPRDFEIDLVEGVINGIKLQKADKPFSSKR